MEQLRKEIERVKKIKCDNPFLQGILEMDIEDAEIAILSGDDEAIKREYKELKKW